MRILLTLLLMTMAAFYGAAIVNPLGDVTNPPIVFQETGGGTAHLASMYPEGYYSFITQSFHITFNDSEPYHYVAVYDGTVLVGTSYPIGYYATIQYNINHAGVYTVYVGHDDISEPDYYGNLVVTVGDL